MVQRSSGPMIQWSSLYFTLCHNFEAAGGDPSYGGKCGKCGSQGRGRCGPQKHNSVTRVENRGTSRVTKCPACGKTFGTVEGETIGIVAEDEEKKQKSLLEKSMYVKFNAKTTMSLNGTMTRVHGVLWSISERECLTCQVK